MQEETSKHDETSNDNPNLQLGSQAASETQSVLGDLEPVGEVKGGIAIPNFIQLRKRAYSATGDDE